MLGVTIGDKHSYHDMKLILTAYPEISPPKEKTKLVEVPGLDGALDLSRVHTGYMQYHRRSMWLEFAILAPRARWPQIHSDIMDALHGEEMTIILDDDPEYGYTGRLSVDAFDPQKVTSGVTITADIEPYKKRLKNTAKSYTVSGSLTANIVTERMPTVPTITSSAAMTMTHGGKFYSLKAGANTFPDVILRAGKNTLTFSGKGTISLEYREGRF